MPQRKIDQATVTGSLSHDGPQVIQVRGDALPLTFLLLTAPIAEYLPSG